MNPRHALDLVRERAGTEVVERIEHLDRTRSERTFDRQLSPPDADARIEADVVVAGGGLSLLVAAELARLGVSVVVVERARAGVAHREWNASDEELVPLVTSGIVSASELQELVVGRYREGICSFHGGAPRRVRGVLDRAVDAGPLLTRVRGVAEQRGVRFVDGASVDAVGTGPDSVRVGFGRGAGGAAGEDRGEIVARVLVDARGASSPYASADLVCPTVGGVLRGLTQGSGPREVDPEVGDILVTTEDVDESSGLQHVWEGFPGRAGEVTVYLFYYARSAKAPDSALAQLYARFFDTLGSYKEGDASMVRPTFGYIPGWSRLSPAPRAPSPRIVLVGDAAARHSPLTFCGFGSMLRSFRPIALSLAMELDRERAPGPDVVPEDAVHMWTGALATVMASGALGGPKLNGLLDAAFGVLEEMGNDDFEALLKDRMSGRRFTEFLRLTGARHPIVYREVLRALGPMAAARWGVRLAREVFA
jgi:lycopene cyclase CruA